MNSERWACAMARTMLEEKDEGAIAAALLRSVNHENTINRLEVALRECYEYFEKNADSTDAEAAIKAIAVRALSVK